MALRVAIACGPGEAPLAAAIGRKLTAHGIEVLFAMPHSFLHLVERPFEGFCPLDWIPKNLELDDQEIVRIDRRVSPPGLASLAFAEAVARRLDDKSAFHKVAASYVTGWERFLTEKKADVLILWQTAGLFDRAGWSAAKGLGLQVWMLTNGPGFFRFPISDVDEREMWTELIARTRTTGPRIPTSEQRKLVNEHIAEVTRIHSKFQPRHTNLFDWRAIAMDLRDYLKMRSSDFDPYAMDVETSNRMRARGLNIMRIAWAWRDKLRLNGYEPADLSEPYVYLALQNGIDVKLTVRNPFYANQETVAEAVADAMPPGVKLYVKEHPNHPGMYDSGRLKKLGRRPNVSVVHPTTDNVSLIRNAKAVVVISSTAGWESYVWRVPVVSLGQNFFNLSRLAFAVDNPNALSTQINKAIAAGRSNYDVNEDEWVWFIAAVLETCHPGSIFGYRSVFGSLAAREHDENGGEIATGILDKLRRTFPARLPAGEAATASTR